jgi:hypothetical protein
LPPGCIGCEAPAPRGQSNASVNCAFGQQEAGAQAELLAERSVSSAETCHTRQLFRLPSHARVVAGDGGF